MKSRHRTAGSIAALDIGSSKIACFIAATEGHGDLAVTGIGHQLSRGVRGGVITDVGEAETSIVAAVHAAEEMAGEQIENVVVNLSGAGMLSRHVSVELALSGGGVSEQDIADILHEGQRSVSSPNTELVHCFPVSYTLDGTRGIKDPKAMIGDQLGAELHCITAPTNLVRNLTHTLARCHLNATDFVSAPHAAALATLAPDEMDLGVTLIDMGGGVTSFAIFQGGRNIFSDQVAIGGAHVTSDIARGLSTSLMHAERLKTLHGSAIATTQDEQVMIDVPPLGEEDQEESDGNQMPRSMLVGIIRPRLEELFEILRGKIEASGVAGQAGRRVVLTGGASQLLGARELASRVLSKQVRGGRPASTLPGLADAVSGPAFATGIGMLQYAAALAREDALLRDRRARSGMMGGMRALGDWFRERF